MGERPLILLNSPDAKMLNMGDPIQLIAPDTDYHNQLASFFISQDDHILIAYNDTLLTCPCDGANPYGITGFILRTPEDAPMISIPAISLDAVEEELDFEANFVDLGIVNTYKVKSFLARDYTFEETVQSLTDSLLLLDQSIDKTRRPTVAETDRAERVARRILLEADQSKAGIIERNYLPQFSLLDAGRWDATIIRPIVADMKKVYVDPAKSADMIKYSLRQLEDEENYTFDKTQYYLGFQDELRHVDELNHLYARTSIKTDETDGARSYIDFIDRRKYLIEGGTYYYDDERRPELSGNRTIPPVLRPYMPPKLELLDKSYYRQPINTSTSAIRYYGLSTGLDARVIDGASTIIEDQLDDQLITVGRGKHGRIKTAVGTIRTNAHLFGGFDKSSDFNKSISRPPIPVPVVAGEMAHIVGLYINRPRNHNNTLYPIYTVRNNNPNYSRTTQYSHYGYNIVDYIRADYHSINGLERIKPKALKTHSIEDVRLADLNLDEHNIVLLGDQNKEISASEWTDTMRTFLPSVGEIVELCGSDIDQSDNFNDINRALAPFNISLSDFTAEHMSLCKIKDRLADRCSKWVRWRKQLKNLSNEAQLANDIFRSVYYIALRNLQGSKGSLLGSTINYDRYSHSYDDMIKRLIALLTTRLQRSIDDTGYNNSDIENFAKSYLHLDIAKSTLLPSLVAYFLSKYDVTAFHNKLNTLLIDQVEFMEQEISSQIRRYLQYNNISPLELNHPTSRISVKDCELIHLLNKLKRTPDLGFELFNKALFQAYQTEHKDYVNKVIDDLAKAEFKRRHGNADSWDGLSEEDKSRYMPDTVLNNIQERKYLYQGRYEIMRNLYNDYHTYSRDIPYCRRYTKKVELEADNGHDILVDGTLDTAGRDLSTLERFATKRPIELDSEDYQNLMTIFTSQYIFLTDGQVKRKLNYAIKVFNEGELYFESEKRMEVFRRALIAEYGLSPNFETPTRTFIDREVMTVIKSRSDITFDKLTDKQKIALLPVSAIKTLRERLQYIAVQRIVEPGDMALLIEGDQRNLYRRSSRNKWEPISREEFEALPKLPFDPVFLTYSWDKLLTLGIEELDPTINETHAIIVRDKEQAIPRGLPTLLTEWKALTEMEKPLKAIVDFSSSYNASLKAISDKFFYNLIATNMRHKEYLGINKARIAGDKPVHRIPADLLEELADIRGDGDIDSRETRLRAFVAKYGYPGAPVKNAEGDRPNFYFWNIADINIPLICRHHDDLYKVATSTALDREDAMDRCIKEWGRVDGSRIICSNCGERIHIIDYSDFEGFGKDDRVIQFRTQVREEDEFDYKIDELDVTARKDNIHPDNDDELRAEQILDNICNILGIELVKTDRDLFFDEYEKHNGDLSGIDHFYKTWVMTAPYKIIKSRLGISGYAVGRDLFAKTYPVITMENIKKSLNAPDKDRKLLEPFTDNFLKADRSPGLFYLIWLGYRYYKKLELIFAILLGILRVTDEIYEYKGTGAERRGKTGGIRMRDPYDYPNDAIIQFVDIEMRVIKLAVDMKKKADSKKRVITQQQNIFDNINNYLTVIKKARNDRDHDRDDREIAEEMRSDLANLHAKIFNTDLFVVLNKKKEIVVSRRRIAETDIHTRYLWPEFLPSMYLTEKLPAIPTEIEVSELVELTIKSPTGERIGRLRALSRRLSEIVMLLIYSELRKTDDIKVQTLSYVLICCASPAGSRYLDYFSNKVPAIKSALNLQLMIYRAFENIGYTSQYAVLTHMKPNQLTRTLLMEYGSRPDTTMKWIDTRLVKGDFPVISRLYDSYHNRLRELVGETATALGASQLENYLEGIKTTDLVRRDLLRQKIDITREYIMRRNKATDKWREYILEMESIMSREIVVERIARDAVEDEKRYRKFLMEQSNSLMRKQMIMNLVGTITQVLSSLYWRKPWRSQKPKKRNPIKQALIQQLTINDKILLANRQLIDKLATTSIGIDVEEISTLYSQAQSLVSAITFMNEKGKYYDEKQEINHMVNEVLMVILLRLFGIIGEVMASLKSQQMSGLADETGRLFEMILEDYRLYYESVFVRNRSITDVLTAVRDKGNKNRKERYVMMSEELQALYKVSRGYGLGNEFKGFDDQLIDAPEDSTLVSEVQGDPFEVLAMVGREGGMEEDGDNGNDGNLDDDAEEGME